MADNLYREEILEHYRDPQNFGALKNYTSRSKQLNPFCGDEIEMYIIKKNDRVSDISFTGTGCAISIAASSMLTEYAKGKSILELTKFSDKDMLGLLNIEVSETRKKCALLGVFVLRECLEVKNQKSKVKNTI